MPFVSRHDREVGTQHGLLHGAPYTATFAKTRAFRPSPCCRSGIAGYLLELLPVWQRGQCVSRQRHPMLDRYGFRYSHTTSRRYDSTS
jgi:hypothetical protein